MIIKLHQIWEFRAKPRLPWRQVRVTNVLGQEIEFQYMDMPRASDLAKTFATTEPEILADDARYRFLSDA